jgi:hypothetical protein
VENAFALNGQKSASVRDKWEMLWKILGASEAVPDSATGFDASMVKVIHQEQASGASQMPLEARSLRKRSRRERA